ncbi:MAG: 7,8-dihydro-8-oxoguanine triphosphatase [Ilumatobacter coccineus]|uniref:7,8-dihydro-8-oxoguanine triphosphatase n=1 Tax=Ilumatobacter coccineus TaxID=467094 RepID=A0A2G6KC28_9ACTN|nr:MAG: 7,8-dihydro-8-oxoguanine triphosphatase [Ilumatobacter coccineus]
MGFHHTPICGCLAYVWDRSTDRVLMVHRIARDHDDHFGLYNGLGGKLEAGETIIDNLRRELSEEAEIQLTSYELRGTIAWPGFGPNGEDWLGFIFLVDGWTGEIPSSNDEGDLVWVDRHDVVTQQLPMWPGDRYFLPLVFDDDRRAFHGVMPYSNGQPTDWRYERL